MHETVDLWVERDSTAELVDEVASDREVRIVTKSDIRLPLSTTAPGKAFLAHGTDDEVRRRVIGHLEARTSRSHTSVESLLADLHRTRETGIGVDLEEHADDVCAVAMIVNLGLIERYAIAIPVPARRFGETRDRLEVGLRNCVRTIEAKC